MLLETSRFPAGRGLSLAMAAFAALALSGCGRYGPLEPPPEANAAAKPAPAPAAPASGASMSSLAKPRIPPITPPNQPFILDPLLK